MQSLSGDQFRRLDVEEHSSRSLPEGDSRTIAQPSECYRCGGRFIGEYYVDLFDDEGRRWCRSLRCVQCGNVVDSVILKNRRLAEADLVQQAQVA